MSVSIPGTMLFQLLAGFFESGPGINELALVSTAPDGDPALFRIGGITGAGGGLAGDIDVSEPDPQTGIRRREMVVLLQYKRDERLREAGRLDLHYGELTGHIRGPIDVAKYGPKDDGMRLVFLVLHDYVWIKGVSTTSEPVKPWLYLPPRQEPPLPPEEPPIITPEERAERVLDIAAAREEFAGMDLDDDKVQAYLSGRTGLREFHDDHAQKATAHDESKHRPGRPY